jgi:hypothetical protein
MNSREPPMRCRNSWIVVETGKQLLAREEVWTGPDYGPDGDRHKGGMTHAQARARNTGLFEADAKGEGQAVVPTRPSVPMRLRGADHPIVVTKSANADGAKGVDGSGRGHRTTSNGRMR